MKKTLFAIGALLLSTASMFAHAETDVVVKPVFDAAPEFPESALRRNAEGYVVVRFDIADNGKARNIEVVDAFPENTFDGAVKTAIRRSEFELVENGNTVTEDGLTNVERVYRFTPEVTTRSLLMKYASAGLHY